jgi:hypothetical protein
MEADFPILMDACVLANHPVTDLLMRLVEGPRLFSPRWTDQILSEAQRALVEDMGWPVDLVERRNRALRSSFPEALVEGYEPLIEQVHNDPKDRHVLAAAIWGDCGVITTFNLSDFSPKHLEPWGIEVQHPSDLLISLFDLNPVAVVSKIDEIAAWRQVTQESELRTLNKHVPSFIRLVAEQLDLELDP